MFQLSLTPYRFWVECFVLEISIWKVFVVFPVFTTFSWVFGGSLTFFTIFKTILLPFMEILALICLIIGSPLRMSYMGLQSRAGYTLRHKTGVLVSNLSSGFDVYSKSDS